MDGDECVEVTVIEPVPDTSTLNSVRACSTKTLSTIRECASERCSSPSSIPRKIIPNERAIAPEEFQAKLDRAATPDGKKNSPRDANCPLDIELLLRLYACNSSMEKSMERVIKEAKTYGAGHSKDSPNYRVCKDADSDDVTRVELGGLHKILEFLLRSRPKSSSFPDCDYRAALFALKRLLDDTNRKQLVNHLANDPSLKKCKYCGVISSSESPNDNSAPPTSPPRSSYFLNTQIFPTSDSPRDNNNNNSNSINVKLHREGRKSNAKSEQRKERPIHRRFAEKVRNESDKEQKGNDRMCNIKRMYGDDKDSNSRETNIASEAVNKRDVNNGRHIENIAAEREVCDKTQETSQSRRSGSNRTLGKDQTETVQRYEGKSRMDSSIDRKLANILSDKHSKFSITQNTRTKETGHGIKKFEDSTSRLRNLFKETLNAGARSNVNSVMYCSQDPRDEKFVFSNSAINGGKKERNPLRGEEVIRDTLHSRLRSGLSSKDGANTKGDETAIPSDDINPAAYTMKDLARSCPATRDEKEKELASQLHGSAFVQSSRPNKRHSFILHANRDAVAQLDTGFWLYDKSNQPSGTSEYNLPRSLFRDYYDNYPSDEHYKCHNLEKDIQKPRNFVSSVEKDSLESCNNVSSTLVQAGDSQSTSFSSSSAENMIREWTERSYKGKDNDVYNDALECDMTNGSKPSPEVVRLARSQVVKILESYADRRPTSSDKLQIDEWSDTWQSYSLEDRVAHGFISARQNVPSNSNVDAKPRSERESETDRLTTRSLCERNFPTSKMLNNPRKPLEFSNKKEKDIITAYENFMFATNSSCDRNKECALSYGRSENLIQRINYDEVSLKSVDKDLPVAAEMLSLYDTIFEATKSMDWEDFQRLVETLHPGKKELWSDVCGAINNEAKRLTDKLGGSAEVCIEISSVVREETGQEARKCRNEIVFEMDITLEDVERFLGEKLVFDGEEQLDTHSKVNEDVKPRNDDVRSIGALANRL